MTEPAVGPVLLFGIVLAPVYLMRAGWFLGRPRGLRLPLIGVGFLAGFIILAWGGMAVLALLLGVVFPGGEVTGPIDSGPNSPYG